MLARVATLQGLHGTGLGNHVHILPDFHGNRTPFGDASLLGSIHGLSLDGSFDGLATLYYRAMVSLALGMRQIIERMEEGRAPVRKLALGGGHAKNPLFTQLYADATERAIAISAGDEAMLLGTAMTAASAAGWYGSLAQACLAWRRPESVIVPDAKAVSALDRDYRIFLRMQQHRSELALLA